MNNQMQQPIEWITSVGIDIGTSTTKMIVSRLKLVRTSGALSLPRFDIVERELLYVSPIYSTPLLRDDEIDADQIWKLLAGEYEQAGIQPSELKSGAVIITGETANKNNAKHIVHKLAERSGDFVVATAGADLEGLLAGKGAGAEVRSLQTRGIVANIDVGGGTANAALFHRGNLVGTVTFHVGGRLIQVDGKGMLLAVSPSLQPWLQASGYKLKVGQRISFELLRDICTLLCRTMLDYMTGSSQSQSDAATHELLLGPPLASIPPIEEWMISGGIGRLMEGSAPEGLVQMAVYQDTGPLLAHILKASLANYPIKLVRADQTVRATVIGAGMQSMEISGATVHLDESLLPIRNLPVVKLELDPIHFNHPAVITDVIAQLLRSGASLYERDASPPFALALSGIKHWTYNAIQLLADKLTELYRYYFPEAQVLVVVCHNDIAKALGQALSRRCRDHVKIVCIDQIKVEHGDYIDLGEPISGIMIPVVVKTLAFPGGQSKGADEEISRIGGR